MALFSIDVISIDTTKQSRESIKFKNEEVILMPRNRSMIEKENVVIFRYMAYINITLFLNDDIIWNSLRLSE